MEAPVRNRVVTSHWYRRLDNAHMALMNVVRTELEEFEWPAETPYPAEYAAVAEVARHRKMAPGLPS